MHKIIALLCFLTIISIWMPNFVENKIKRNKILYLSKILPIITTILLVYNALKS